MTIPDYKVRAALKAFDEHEGSVGAMRAALEAAEAAQEPPQIEVTEAQIYAGCRAAWDAPWKVLMHRDVAVAVYRAMKALEKKPEAKPVLYRRVANTPTGSYVHYREDERSGKERRINPNTSVVGKVFRAGKGEMDGTRSGWQRRQTQGDER